MQLYQPSVLILHITERCNLRCRYCFQSEINAMPDMELPMGKSAIDWFLANIGDTKKMTIRYFGGEPMLKFELIEALTNYADEQAVGKGLELEYQITTNGTILSQKILDFCKNHRISLLFSIDGRQACHDKNRVTPTGRGSFGMISRNFPLIFSYDKTIKLGARLTFVSDTIHLLADNLEFLAETGFPVLSFAPIDEMQWDSDLLKLLRKELEKVLHLWQNLFVSGRKVKIRPLQQYLKNIDDIEYPWHLYSRKCQCIKDALSVTSNGDVFPCHRFVAQRAFRLGNIRNDNLQTLNIPTQVLDATFHPGCPSLNYRRTGDVQKKPAGVMEVMKMYYDTAKRMKTFNLNGVLPKNVYLY